MTINDVKLKLDAEAVVLFDKPVEGAYAGDFLSRVMSKAPSGCVWLTVMNNVNVAGVAALAEIGAIVLCEGVVPDPVLCDKCRAEEISLLTTRLDVFSACVRLGS